MSAKRESEKQKTKSSEARHEPWKLDSDKYPVNYIHNHGEWKMTMRRKLSWEISNK